MAGKGAARSSKRNLPRASNRTSVANPESERIRAMEQREAHWRRWGPYLSARQWGTVREDYSADGNAWDYFPFDMAHVRTYRTDIEGATCFRLNGKSVDPDPTCSLSQIP